MEERAAADECTLLPRIRGSAIPVARGACMESAFGQQVTSESGEYAIHSTSLARKDIWRPGIRDSTHNLSPTGRFLRLRFGVVPSESLDAWAKILFRTLRFRGFRL